MNVDAGPWPGIKYISSPRGHNLFLTELMSWSKFPPGKSVLPMEPLNKTSPTRARLAFLLKKIMCPGE